MKVFIPDGVEVSIDGLCSLLGFTNLNCYIRVTGARFVFSLQALSTHHCLGETHGSTQKDKGNLRLHNVEFLRLGRIFTSDADLR